MINIQVTINKDNFSRENYSFAFFDTTLVLDTYYLETKPRGKRKWTVVQKWSRLFPRNNTIEQPVLHIGIRNEALSKLKELLTVKTWEEYKQSKS